MAEQGPSGLPPPKPDDIAKKASEAIAVPAAIEGIEQLADKFAEICAQNLDQNLTPQTIKENLIKQGFPAGLANYLGASLIERIADARQSMVVAATKPKLKDALIANVKEEVIEYFKSRETEFVRFMEVTQDPVVYLNVISEVLGTVDTDQVSDENLEKAFNAVYKIYKEVPEKIMRPVTKYALQYFLDKGFEAKMISNTQIEVPNTVFDATGKDDTSTKFWRYTTFGDYLRKRFPKVHFEEVDKDRPKQTTIILKFSYSFI